MEALFLQVLNMSISASWMIVAVLVIRWIFHRLNAPKRVCYILWLWVAVRLLCPISLESGLSLIPSGETFSEEFLYEEKPEIHSGIEEIDNAVNPIISQQVVGNQAVGSDQNENGAGNETPSVDNQVGDENYSEVEGGYAMTDTGMFSVQKVVYGASILWCVGIIGMMTYTLICYYRLKKTVRISTRLRDNLWICDGIRSPFILGLFQPRIYLPSHIEEEQIRYIIAHENEHLKYHDNWWKPLGFVVLAIHWFNPLVWVAYISMCRDIEISCDERVIDTMNMIEKKKYMESLLLCSSPRHMVSACPVAFGEIGIKERIKGIVNYKKPAGAVFGIFAVVCVIVFICFLTNPKDSTGFEEWTKSITPEDIYEVRIEKIYNQEITEYDISEDEYEKICTILNTITDDSCTSGEVVEVQEGYELFLSREEKLWRFRCLEDGTIGLLFEDIETATNYGYREQFLVIDCPQLWNYIIKTVDGDWESNVSPFQMINYVFDYSDQAKVTTSELGSIRTCKLSRNTKAIQGLSSIFYMYDWEKVENLAFQEVSTWIKIQAEIGDSEIIFWDVNGGIIECNIEGEDTVYWTCEKKENTTIELFDAVWNHFQKEWNFSYRNHDGESLVQLVHIVGMEELFADYDGQEICHIFVDNSHGTMNRDDLVYYRTEETDIQKVLKVMVTTMIEALMEPSENRPYTVTQFRVDEMEVIQGADNIWFIPYIQGAYKYDGTDMGTFEEQLPYVEVDEDGLIPFFGQGSDGVFYYILIKDGDVYRLERGEVFTSKYDYMFESVNTN